MPVDVGALVWVQAFGKRWPAKITALREEYPWTELEFDGPRELRLEAFEAGWHGRWLVTHNSKVTPRDAETCPEQAGPTQPPPEPPPGR
jgi:hypothetical protein